MYDPNRPLKFTTKDGQVAVITYEYLFVKMNEPITNIISSLSSMNNSLQQISDRIDTWLENQQ